MNNDSSPVIGGHLVLGFGAVIVVPETGVSKSVSYIFISKT